MLELTNSNKNYQGANVTMHDPASTASEALRRGYAPVVLKPGTKKPVHSGWTTITYPDAEALRSEFISVANDLDTEPDMLNVGVALGKPSGGLVDIDVDHPKALLVAAALLPNTAMRSGRDGNPSSHFWFRVTGEDFGIRQFKLPNKSVVIEYRGTGGQTVLPESTHPEGDLYRWEGVPWGGSQGPAEVDAEELMAAVRMIALLVTLADAWPTKGSRHSAYLALAGGLLRDVEDDGVTPRLHPLWERNIEGVITLISELTHDGDGARTRVDEVVHTTRRKLLKGAKVQGWPTLVEMLGEKYVEVVREHVEALEELDGTPRNTRQPRDSSAVQQPVTALPEGAEDGEPEEINLDERMKRFEMLDPSERDPLLERVNSWQPVDLGVLIMQGVKRPEPTLLKRSDGAGLFYRNRVNSLYGSGGSGKTWIALQLACEVMAAKEKVLMIDFEDEPAATIDRIRSLHPNGEQMLTSGLFAYICPDEPVNPLQTDRWGNPATSQPVMAAQQMLLEALRRYEPSLVIVDGVTTLYGMHGLNVNDAVHTDAVGRWLRWLGNHNTRTTLLIDHTPKNAAAGSGPTGSQHKTSMIQGTALQVQSFVSPREGSKGMAKLYVGKDRPGGVNKVSLEGDPRIAADVHFDSTVPGRMTITLEPADEQAVVVDATNARKRDLEPKASAPSAEKEKMLTEVVLALKAMHTPGGSTLKEIRMKLRTRPESAVRTALFEGLERGLVAQAGEGKATRYSLTDR